MIREPGYVTRDHVLTLPLVHEAPDGRTIDVFAREFVAVSKVDADLPWLVFLQGGPGGKGPRPLDASSWVGVALERFRVLMLDQRGTGRSTRIDSATETRTGADLAEYLGHFRADSIVADAEAFRAALTGGRPWSTLGQSYGGFVTLTYLSRHPEALTACYVTGGIPGIGASVEDVYERTFPRVAERSEQYYARYPGDRAIMRRLADRLLETDVRLPDGDRLTVRRLQVLGSVFGMSYGFETVHWLLDELGPDATPTSSFLYQVMVATGFVDCPLYPLQEYTYGQGAATRWAAHRERERRPEFAESADPVLFTGETMFPWMFSEIRSLRPYAEAADLLAERSDWPPLYDPDRLAANEVPLVAAVYYDDIYVDSGLQLDTLSRVGASRAWVTNEHEHDGLRSAPDVLRHLFDLADQRR